MNPEVIKDLVQEKPKLGFVGLTNDVHGNVDNVTGKGCEDPCYTCYEAPPDPCYTCYEAPPDPRSNRSSSEGK